MEDRLYKFAGLVDAGSFTKAAQRLHISQPALTTAVKKLERELHAELLIRGGHKFQLTEAGKQAYQAAQTIKTESQNLKLRLLESSNAKVSLRLGMIDSIADMLFVHGDTLNALEQETQLSLTVDNTTRLLQYIEHDLLDVAFVAKPSSLPQGLAQESIGQEPLVLVTHSSQEQATRAALEQGHLHHFLGYNQHSRTYRLVSAYFARHGITLDHTFYSTSPEIMLQLVLANRGSAVLPYLLVKEPVEQGKLAIVPIDSTVVIPRDLVVIKRSGRVVPAQLNALVAQTTQRYMALHDELDRA